MKLAGKLLRNFFILSMGNVIGQVLLLLGIVQVGRLIGPAAFGWWSFAQVCFLYLLRAGEFGLEVSAIREVAADRSLLAHRVTSVLSLRMTMATLLYAATVIVVLTGVIPSQASLLVLIFSVGVFPVALAVEWVYEAIQSPFFISLVRIGKGLLFFLLVVFFVNGPHQVELSALSYVISLIIPALFLLFIARRQFGLEKIGSAEGEPKKLLLEAYPIGIATLLSQYSLFFSTILLGYASTALNLGYFTAAHRLVVFVWAYGLVASNRVVLPVLARLQRESEEDYLLFILRTTRTLALIALPVGVIGASVSPDLIEFLYGASFKPSVIVFQILLWALVVAVMRSVYETALISSGQQKKYLKGMFFLAVAHTILTPFGFMLNGITGIAIAMVAAECTYAAYLVLVFKSTNFFQLAKSLWKPLIASCIILGVLFFFSMPLFVAIIVGVVIYLLSLVILGELSRSDLQIVKEVIGL